MGEFCSLYTGFLLGICTSINKNITVQEEQTPILLMLSSLGISITAVEDPDLQLRVGVQEPGPLPWICH